MRVGGRDFVLPDMAEWPAVNAIVTNGAAGKGGPEVEERGGTAASQTMPSEVGPSEVAHALEGVAKVEKRLSGGDREVQEAQPNVDKC